MTQQSELGDPGLILDPTGTARSERFGDVYFSAEGGLAETRTLFLEGTGLPERFAAGLPTVILETGFGTGLNCAAALALWRASQTTASLDFASIEGFPLNRHALKAALGQFPELGDAAQAVAAAYPVRLRPGLHVAPLSPCGRARLILGLGEALDRLRDFDLQADAVFLDGFAPSRNPEMWRPEVLAEIRRLCRPGARLASFTVAGMVRRGLAELGFHVERAPGFGRKKESLRARLDSSPATTSPGSLESALLPPGSPVLILGAGIAGASLAAALRRFGLAPLLLEAAAAPGAGASGNAQAGVMPRLSLPQDPAHRFYPQAAAHALDQYARLFPAEQAGRAWARPGAMLLADSPAEAARQKRVSACWPGLAEALDPSALAERLGQAVTAEASGLFWPDAGWVRPPALLPVLLECIPLQPGRPVAALRQVGAAGREWAAFDHEGRLLGTAPAVILALGAEPPPLLPPEVSLPPLQRVAGAIALLEGGSGLRTVLTAESGGYALPHIQPEGRWVAGASFVPLRPGLEPPPEALSTRPSLEALAQLVPGLLDQARLVAERAAIRSATPDRLPLCGALGAATGGLWILGGLGARGFTTAPLLAEALASWLAGRPSPLSRTDRAMLDPQRFARRAARRRD